MSGQKAPKVTCSCGKGVRLSRWGRIPFHYSLDRSSYPNSCPGAGVKP